jgi:hypothetical protein
LNAGAFTDFPCNQYYLKDNIKSISLAPYVRVGKHEFYAGMVCSIKKTNPTSTIKYDFRPGAFAGYTFYVFNPAGRENMYLNYSFQYLNFKENINFEGSHLYPPNTSYTIKNKTSFINNVFSLGYVVYFDTQQRFGLYYTLGYVVSLNSIYNQSEAISLDERYSRFVWNNLCTNVGLSFKLKSFDKKAPK